MIYSSDRAVKNTTAEPNTTAHAASHLANPKAVPPTAITTSITVMAGV